MNHQTSATNFHLFSSLKCRSFQRWSYETDLANENRGHDKDAKNNMQRNFRFFYSFSYMFLVVSIVRKKRCEKLVFHNFIEAMLYYRRLLLVHIFFLSYKIPIQSDITLTYLHIVTTYADKIIFVNEKKILR